MHSKISEQKDLQSFGIRYRMGYRIGYFCDFCLGKPSTQPVLDYRFCSHCYNEFCSRVSNLKQQLDEINRLKKRDSFLYSIVRKQSPREKAQVMESNLRNTLCTVATDIRSLYSRYTSSPPDWKWRREIVIRLNNRKCSNCGRKYGGKVPFHIHHDIPRSKGGLHSLENLTLLCEICHARVPGRGHKSIAEKRKERLERKRKDYEK